MRNVIGVALAFLVACGESDSTKPKPDLPPGSVLVGEVTIPPHGMPEEPTVPTKKYLLDATLRLNEIQLKGSHNSYHLWVDNGEPEWAYDVPPLAVQLEYQGVRAFELDVHYMYGRFGVYQVPGWESRSTCPWLEECLAQILTWSNANPGHVPLIVYFETRDTGSDVFYEHVAEFEQAIVAAIPRAKMYTPDDLLGTTYQDVTSALQAKGWPTLGEVRGKIIIVLHDFGASRYRYLRDGGMRGKRMFVSGVRPEHPQAGFLALDEPVENIDTLKNYVARGYMVRTRSDDLPTQGGDRWVKRDAALRSGAQLVLTDYPEGNYIPGYYVEMPDGKPARCNPITTPREPGACTAEGIEDPELLKTWVRE